MDFNGTTIEDDFDVAISALHRSVSRCVTLGQAWDTHADNDTTQSTLFEELFTGLRHLKSRLEQHLPVAVTDETVVVVFRNGANPPTQWNEWKRSLAEYVYASLGAGLEGTCIGSYDSYAAA